MRRETQKRGFDIIEIIFKCNRWVMTNDYTKIIVNFQEILRIHVIMAWERFFCKIDQYKSRTHLDYTNYSPKICRWNSCENEVFEGIIGISAGYSVGMHRFLLPFGNIIFRFLTILKNTILLKIRIERYLL